MHQVTGIVGGGALDAFSAAVNETLFSAFGEVTHRNWMCHLHVISSENGLLKFSTPSAFIHEWIEDNYLAHIKKTLCEKFADVSDVKLVLDLSRRAFEDALPAPRALSAVATQADNVVRIEPAQTIACDIFDFNLDPRFTFENFVVGQSNLVAYNAAKAVAENRLMGSSNILYIHSPVGMGKTHLLQSVASQMKQLSPARKVVYLSAEKFMHLYLKYMRANDLIGFKEKVKSSDVFLVDDLQFICGKAATQAEFGNLLSALTEANKTVVISADANPFALNLDARSKSRLVGGIVVEIAASDYELKLGILRAKAAQNGANVSEDVLAFIATSIMASNRELEGALNKLIVHASFEGGAIDMAFAKRLLKANVESSQVKADIDGILKAVAAQFEVDVKDIISKSRAAKFILPRQIAAYLAKTLTTKSLQDIGYALGKRDHASVIYSVKQVEEKMKETPSIAEIVAELTQKVHAA